MKRSETAAAELLVLIPALNRYGLPGITLLRYAFHGTSKYRERNLLALPTLDMYLPLSNI